MSLRSQFLRFAAVGLGSSLTTYLVLIILVELWQADAVVASALGFVAGMVVNYSLNYRYTFRSSRSHRSVIPKYTAVMIAGLAINTLVMAGGVNWLGVNYLLTQLAAIFVVMLWSFSANRLWAFGRDTPAGR
jgi:putative flippase GtrA